ncbi:MAG: VOC family protein [Pyrinomonadaceae bacterium]
MRNKSIAITPYLYYEDVDAALSFLAKAFGFRKYGRAMRAADRKTNHAGMTFARELIMMGRPGSKYKNPKRLKQATQSLYIKCDERRQAFEAITKSCRHDPRTKAGYVVRTPSIRTGRF